jgi:hypothetical protein
MKADEKTLGSPLPAEKLRYLSELEVFQDLSPREMEDINRMTTMSTVPKGRVFYRPEEPGEVLFILKEGKRPTLSHQPGRARSWSSPRWGRTRSLARWRCWAPRCTTPLPKRWKTA